MQSLNAFHRMYLSAKRWGLQPAFQVLGVDCWLNLNHNGLGLLGSLLGGTWAKVGTAFHGAHLKHVVITTAVFQIHHQMLGKHLWLGGDLCLWNAAGEYQYYMT